MDEIHPPSTIGKVPPFRSYRLLLLLGAVSLLVLPLPALAGDGGLASPVDPAHLERSPALGTPPSHPSSSSEYPLTFTESGLPAGTLWYVNLSSPVKVSGSSTTTTINFELANDTYYFTIETPISLDSVTVPDVNVTIALEQYVAPSGFGSVVVEGATNYPTIVYSVQYMAFATTLDTTDGTTSGLGYYAPGTLVTISAASYAGYVFTNWTGLPLGIFVGDDLCASYYSGPERVAQVTLECPLLEVASFAQLTYDISFTQNSLPAGTDWDVTFNGTTSAETSDTLIPFTAPNGTYTYSVESPILSGPGTRYVWGAPASPSVTVRGQSVVTEVVFQPQYYVTVSATSGGSVNPVNAWFSPGAAVDLTATPNPGYAFVGWVGNGPGAYTGSANPVTVEVNSTFSETASFAQTFPVTVTENGLPAGTNWSVNVEFPVSSTSSALSFSVPRGVYNFSVGYVPGYRTSTEQGTISVDGAAVNLTLHFVRTTYLVAFYSRGAVGSNWSVTIGSETLYSGGSSILNFSLANDSVAYTFDLAPPSGYSANVTSGSFRVDNGSVGIWVAFKAVSPPSNGLLGIGATPSYIVLGIGVALAVLVVGIWVMVILGAESSSRPPPAPPKEAEEQPEEGKDVESSAEPKAEEKPSEEAPTDEKTD